jgi:Tol biopolymer transport system component/imidazolonepropionase-like amidohydrolase
MRSSLLFAIVLLGGAQSLPAQDSVRTARWDVTQARGATRVIDFTTSEGTEMSVDISPDNRWVVFDLLAHIYRVPVAGGQAEVLTQSTGVALNYHPRISPDGRLIAFVSDRDGQNNLYIMNADGSAPKAVFRDVNVRVSTPAWTPDGQYIIVRRQALGGEGGGGGGGLWMYHRDGGQGVQLVNDAAAAWPTVSADGKYLYYMVRVQGGSDPVRGRDQIRRFEFATGKMIDITSGVGDGAAASRGSSGGAFAPEIAPDGRWIAFGRQIPDGTINFKGHRFGPRTALWLLDMETGRERVLMDPIGIVLESGGLRPLPGYAWARDGKSIVLSQGGEIRRVDVATGAVTTIPFAARVNRTISEMAYKPFRITDGSFTSKFLRWTTASPDGRRLAFQSIGRIWITDMPASANNDASQNPPRRLTTDNSEQQEFAPAWSPDGQWLAYTTWHDTAGGHLWKVPTRGGAPVRLTATAGEYLHPTWSPDSRELLLVKGAGVTRAGRSISANPWFDVVRIPAAGGNLQLVARASLPTGQAPNSMARRAIMQPSYGPEGRIFFPELKRPEAPAGGRGGGGGTQMALVSYKPDGTDRREHVTLPNADEMVASPDGKWVAFEEGDNLFLGALPWFGTGADPLTVNKRRGTLPVRTLSLEGGLFPRWRSANVLEFSSANRHFTYNVETQKTDSVSISLEVPRRTPTGAVVLNNARIVTLKGDEVIDRGSVVVQGARIACVGQCTAPAGAQVIDAAGKTIIPGFVDMHSHHYREHRGFRPLRDYEVGIYLAYGVTTSLDNSMWSQNIFPTAELIEAGRMIGPRTFSSGDPLYRGDAARQNELTSYDAAKQNVARLLSYGAVSMKQYQQPRRDQRQWVSDAARRLGAMVTAEGGDLWYNLSMIMDGQTGWEHPIDEVPLYSDVTRFMGMAKAHYSPTLVVGGPGAWNIEYFFAERDVWKDPKQQRFMPWRNLFGHLRRRNLRPTTDYSYPLLAQGMADIIAAGGYGAIGSHGEHHGLAPHWEVWMGASALGNHGALKVASLSGAHMLGADQDIGSIEVGKLADLMVLNSNPLENIRNTLDMKYVMKGGVLYDSETLDEIWPEKKPFGPYYWVDKNALKADEIPFDIWKRR